MNITGNWDRRRLSRRDFLAMSGMGAAALALGTNGLLLPRTALAQIDYSDSRNPFTLGVASGDPLPDGVVLWTRLAPDPLNGGDMPNLNVKVSWEVATGGDLKAGTLSGVVQQGETTATPGLAHSVHLEVTGLEAGTHYYYRFNAGGHPSPVGRTKTAPEPGSTLSQVKFAVVSCQSYQAGYWAPFHDIATNPDLQDPIKGLDCVIHVGDYIYEFGTWTGYAGPWRLYQTAAPKDLATYRNRHAEYKYAPYINDEEPAKTGEDWGLQEAHAAHPWICTWDDHEMVNDYAGGDLGRSSRRNAAYQAYYEHMPIRPSRIKKTDWSSMELYHDIAYGDLARFCVLDTRQYRTKHACKTSGLANCSDRFKSTLSRKQHTILGRGDAQEKWLKNALSDYSDLSKTTTWKVLPNQVRMSEFDHEDGSAESYRMEEWDGYVATRNRISEHIYDGIQNGTIENVVAITGDMHAAWAADLKYHDPDPNKSYKQSDPKSIIGTEIAGTSACSDLGSWWKDTYTSATNENDNPHVKYLSTKEGGYVLCTVSAASFEAQYRVVRDKFNSNGKPVDGRYDPLSPLDTIATATVSDGTPGLPDNSVSGVGSVSLASGVTAEEPRERVPRVEPPRGRDTR